MKTLYFLLALLIFLVSCGSDNSFRTVSTQEYQASLNETNATSLALSGPCVNMTCPQNQTCKNGNCVCASGKSCQGKCIPLASCCTNAECPSGACTANRCTVPPTCRYGEVLSNGECTCGPTMKSCKEQNKCISRNSCCVSTNCDSIDRCMPTSWFTSVCAQSDSKKVCRSVADNNVSVSLPVNTTSLKLFTENWLANGNLILSINNQSFTLVPNERITLPGNLTLFQEGITVVGGTCREFVEAIDRNNN